MRHIIWILALMGLQVSAQDYRVGPSDLLKISVIELDAMAGEYRVDPSGNINLPFVGPLNVKKMTVDKIREELGNKLSERDLVKQPQVFVDILEVNWRPINVIGAVKTPGKLKDVYQDVRLVDALTRAGGLQEKAGDMILVMRSPLDGPPETLKISYQELMIQGLPYLNIPILAGDTINIPMEEPLMISVLGEVNKPGEYEFKANLKVTLLRVVASAGGFTDFAKRQKVAVRRAGKEVVVDVRAIQEKGEVDYPMQNGDIVFVP